MPDLFIKSLPYVLAYGSSDNLLIVQRIMDLPNDDEHYAPVAAFLKTHNMVLFGTYPASGAWRYRDLYMSPEIRRRAWAGEVFRDEEHIRNIMGTMALEAAIRMGDE